MIIVGEERKWKMDTNNERFKVFEDMGIHYGKLWFGIQYDTDGRKQVVTEEDLENRTIVIPSKKYDEKNEHILCHCHDRNEPVWWQNENYNAFIDNNGEMEVTVNGYTKCFRVDYCPKCGKKF